MSMMPYCTPNVDVPDARGAGRYDRLLNLIADGGFPYLFIMGSPADGLEVASHVQFLHFRGYNPFNDGIENFDNKFHDLHTPQAVIQKMNNDTELVKLRDAMNSNLVINYGWNEQGQPTGLKPLLDWWIELWRLAKANNWRLATEFATAKTLNTNDLNNGLWDAWLRERANYIDYHFVTTHVYTTGLVAANFMPNYPQNLLERSTYEENNWPDLLTEISWERSDAGEYPGNWHIGREAWWFIRAKEIGVEFQLDGIGEGILDWMPDIEWFKMQLRPYGDDRYFKDIRGFLAHRSLWEAMRFGKMTDAEFSNYAWIVTLSALRAYQGRIKYLSIFGYNPDWQFPEGFDISADEMIDYIKLMAGYNKALPQEEPKPIPEPEEDDMPETETVGSITYLKPIMRKALVHKGLGDGILIRSEPRNTGFFLFTLTGLEIECNVSETTLRNLDGSIYIAAGLEWYKIHCIDNGVIGYVAKVNNLIIEPGLEAGWQFGTFSFAGLNFRELPGLKTTTIMTLNGEFAGRQQPTQLTDKDGFHWMPIVIFNLVSSTKTSGWVAFYKNDSPNTKWYQFVPTPEPDPVPVPDPTPDPVPDPDHAMIEELVRAILLEIAPNITPDPAEIEKVVRAILLEIAPDIIREAVRELFAENLRRVDFDIPYYTDPTVNPLVADVLALILRQVAIDAKSAIDAMAIALAPQLGGTQSAESVKADE